MTSLFFRLPVLCWITLVSSITFASAQITVINLTDEEIYTDQRTFSVPSVAGYDYSVFLNEEPIPTNTNITVDRMDYYELYVERQLSGGGLLETRTVQFIILSSDRGSPERGLIEWTPYPSIPSTPDEFAGGQLQVVMPQDYPQGLQIPVVVSVTDGEGNAIRANGMVAASGFESTPVKVLRGVGSGYLPGATGAGTIDYQARLHSLAVDKTVQIEETTTWTPVVGTLVGSTDWPENSRINLTGNITLDPGSTLTIGAGTVVLLEPGVDIINSGSITINGTTERPVVFMATGEVKPHQHEFAWGGFIMRGVTAELVANGTILYGAGSDRSFSFSPGASHRPEQAMLLVHSGARAALTNCYLLNNAGQVANGYDSEIIYDHCLLQRAITAGEFERGAVTINHTAIIEFPEESGEVTAELADADYDAIYFTEGTHQLLNSLIGFCKDDAIDAGSGGAGSVVVSNCWVEAALHEALAWSGTGRETYTYDTILINNGQGIEAGWSSGSLSPLVHADRLLSTANSVGARFGDNYDWSYNGSLNVSNSLILHNYRDIWGYNWADWTYRVGQMNLFDNYVSTVNTNHPNNTLWDPSVHADELAHYMRTPSSAPVGVGLALWDKQYSMAEIASGIPVRLSTFTVNEVTVDYELNNSSGSVVEQGSLTFAPGETLKQIMPDTSGVLGEAFATVRLNNPVNGELTGVSSVFYLGADTNPPPTTTTLIAAGSSWKYLVTPEDIDASWNTLAYTDINWAEGAAQLGYGDGDETTVVSFGGDPDNKFTTTYFRKTLGLINPGARYDTLEMTLLRDDGAVVYINGAEVFRSPNMPAPPTPITYDTRTVGPNGENSIDRATFSADLLQEGANLFAVEIHQADPDSSDMSFDFQMLGLAPPASPPLRWAWQDGDLALLWGNPNFQLESASDVEGPWNLVPGAESPYQVRPDGGVHYYRLRKD